MLLYFHYRDRASASDIQVSSWPDVTVKVDEHVTVTVVASFQVKVVVPDTKNVLA
jgi:hypothetical protein